MSDELNKYPGTMKHHKVDKDEQRKLLCEMMKDDAKSGLYAATRQYLYTAEDIYGKDGLDEGMSRDEIWHAYEAARAKDAELIQYLVDALAGIRSASGASQAAYLAGFKPTQAE